MSDTRRETEVPDRYVGQGLLDYLSSRFSYQSRIEWEEHLRGGRLELNGSPCAADGVLLAGDRVAFTPPEYEEPPVPDNWKILYEDDAFVFIDKPAGLPCHPSGIYRTHTLWNLLQPMYGTVHLVNRLDRETSGIIAAAKSGEWAARASKAMQLDSCVKEYRVAVEGTVKEPIDARGYLIRDAGSPVRKKLAFVGEKETTGGDAPDPADSAAFVHTRFLPLQHADGMSELRAELYTGKTHQIRATLQGLGFPVVGDKLYGRDPTAFLRFMDGKLTEKDRAMLRMDRQALHCERMAFRVSSDRQYDLSAPMPADWPFRK